MASASPTIVLVPLCVPGHLPPLFEAGKRLLSSGAMSLTVLFMQMTMAANLMSDVTDLIRRESESGLDIRFHHLPAVELPTDSHGTEDFIMRFIQLHAPHVKAALSGLASPVAAVVVDYFCTTLFDVTRELALPVYAYLPCSASMLALILRLPALDEEVSGDLGDMEAVDVPGMPPVPAALLPTPLMTRGPNYAWLVYHGKRIMEAAGVIVYTVAELEPNVLAAIAEGRCVPGRRAPTVYLIGPALSVKAPGKQPHECVTWLDAQPSASVVLLCFGSMGGSFPAPQVREIADALERSGHRFLWVLRGPVPAGGAPYPTDANVDELLPEGFLERTKDRGLVWPKWAPQKDIIAHPAVSGFVTHCGWNSVLESLWNGVPLAPWPLFAEQHLKAFELVSVMGVAVAMEVDRKRGNFVEAAELERAVRSLMGGSEEGRKARVKAAEAKALCRNAVEEGGSSYVSLQELAREMLQHCGREAEDSASL
ncbi:hypothetical protein SETIT_2G324700v2 [Setaria italica]|uniref:Glycosyltransferase n=2 Tax=Setaria italica TaxID=4555 RepID=A0A368Q560_SETIT|nr:anthocyanidin 3-O-glucosyltransferase 2 [Setaria italica]RCV13155.1 hypothetical protein SETIT_2G324700v2 [Setaria italica]